MKFNAMTRCTSVSAVAGVLALTMAGNAQAVDYEIWAADQSNSVAGKTSRGVDGSFLQVFSSADVEDYVNSAGPLVDQPAPLPCNGGITPGPCDIHDIFPGTLVGHDAAGVVPGSTAASDGPIGRFHGGLPDPQHKYVNINLFAPGKGFVGIVKADTKEAVSLYQVTKTASGNTMHMTFWNSDGTALMIANLSGRILERINITRDEHGNITATEFDRAASMSVGSEVVAQEARVYLGANGAGNSMIGSISAAGYDAEATNPYITGTTECRQNNCDGTTQDVGRPVNVIVCPIVSSNDKVYVTFGGGGLLVADGAATPMQVVGRYDRTTVNGAGCGGVEVGGHVYLNAGASAAGSGATQSTATMYRFPTAFPDAGTLFPSNFPKPRTLFKDAGNTATIGNASGPASIADGQLPGTTVRRDAHGMIATVSGHYIHNVDRLQNNVIVYDTATGQKIPTDYSLTTTDACSAVADADVPAAYKNDPAPDLMDRSPNGDFLFFAARGPVPVSVTHNAQGACPGAGVIKLDEDGKSGELVRVVRTYNTVDDSPAAAPGGYAYTGTEHSDPHGVSAVVVTPSAPLTPAP